MKDLTPEQIAARAAQIQRGWSEETERRRRGVIEQPYTIPEVRLKTPTEPIVHEPNCYCQACRPD